MALLFEKGNEIKALSGLLNIIWTHQPLTSYSPELGNVLLQAFSIAYFNTEVSSFVPYENFCDAFFIQMIDPNTETLERQIETHLKNNTISMTCSEDSIAFWSKTSPTVAQLITMLSPNICNL
jgi:hypothetical protein